MLLVAQTVGETTMMLTTKPTNRLPLGPELSNTAVQEMIGLQRRLFERHRKIIESQEQAASRTFNRYRNAYRRAVADYEEESGFGALCDAIASSRVAFIADYHTLRLAQTTFTKIIKGVAHQVDNLCLALEFVDETYQSEVDRYLLGKIRERTFLQRIRYREQWPYDIWPSFKPIFEMAADLGYPVIAIDSDSSLPLAERDRRAAKRIAAAAELYPDATILVFTGQMHVAPCHLPDAVQRSFTHRGMPEPTRVIVYQNAEEIYWKLARRRREGVEVVRIDKESYCVNNTPPLVQQLSYLHWVQFDQDLLDFGELERTLRSLIVSLGRFLRLPIGEEAQKVRVMMPGDLVLLEALEEGRLEEMERRRVLAQVEAEQSAYIPALNLIYLATLSVNHAAEEAAHFVKHAVCGAQPPTHLKDLFYFHVLHEACGFFGSKIINPKRKTDHTGKLRQTVARSRKRKGRRQAPEIAAAFALDHLSWERGGTAPSATARSLARPEVFVAAAHILGYILGDRLYYGLLSGEVPKKTIRKLFLKPLDGPNEALKTYLELSEQVRSVKIPRRI